MKFHTLLISAAIAILVTACGVSTQNTSNNDVKDIVRSIKYAKDYRTGLCFAVILSRSYGFNHVASITTVPCNAVSNDLLQ